MFHFCDVFLVTSNLAISETQGVKSLNSKCINKLGLTHSLHGGFNPVGAVTNVEGDPCPGTIKHLFGFAVITALRGKT